MDKQFEKAQHLAAMISSQIHTRPEVVLPPSSMRDPLNLIEEEEESQDLSSNNSLVDPGSPTLSAISIIDSGEELRPISGIPSTSGGGITVGQPLGQEPELSAHM